MFVVHDPQITAGRPGCRVVGPRIAVRRGVHCATA
jgi:hypothetical protein